MRDRTRGRRWRSGRSLARRRLRSATRRRARRTVGGPNGERRGARVRGRMDGQSGQSGQSGEADWAPRKRARRLSSRRKPRGSGFALDPPTRPGSEWGRCATRRGSRDVRDKDLLLSTRSNNDVFSLRHSVCARVDRPRLDASHGARPAVSRRARRDPGAGRGRLRVRAVPRQGPPRPLGLDAPASVFSEARAAAFVVPQTPPGSRARTPSTPRSRSSSGRSAGWPRRRAPRLRGGWWWTCCARAFSGRSHFAAPACARRASRRWRTIVWTRSPRGFGFWFLLMTSTMLTATSLDTRCCSPRISTRCTSRPAGAITPPTSPSSSRRFARSPPDSAVRTLRRIASITRPRVTRRHACRSRTIHLRHRHTTTT